MSSAWVELQGEATPQGFVDNPDGEQHGRGAMVKFGRHLQFLRQDQRTPAYLVEYKKVSTLLGQEDAFTAAWCGTL